MDLIKLAIIFLLVVILLGLKKPLHFVMLGATVLLAIFFTMPMGDFLLCFGQSLISTDTVSVALVIWLVMLLEGVMNNAGYMERMLKAIDDLFHSRRVDIVSMPMIIGFLPSAGGALFSAPMVENSTQGLGFSAEKKTIINSYYRHIMEIFFPTYPSIIIVSQLSKVPLATLSLYLFPTAVIAFFAGFIFLHGMPKQGKSVDKNKLLTRLWGVILALWPFILLIMLIMAFSMEVWLACLLTLAVMLIVLKIPIKQLPQLVKKNTKWKLILAAVVVMAFKDVLLACGAVDRLPELVNSSAIPPIILFALLTTFISMITGATLSASAISIPLVMVAIPGCSVGTIALIHFAAYIGAQLTPTHLCITITAEYYNANLQKLLLQSMPVYLALYALSIVVYGFIL